MPSPLPITSQAKVKKWKLMESIWVPRRTTSAGKDFYDTPATKQAAFTADWEMASARMSLGKKIQRGSDKLDEPDPTPLETFRDVMAKSVWLV